MMIMHLYSTYSIQLVSCSMTLVVNFFRDLGTRVFGDKVMVCHRVRDFHLSRSRHIFGRIHESIWIDIPYMHYRH